MSYKRQIAEEIAQADLTEDLDSVEKVMKALLRHAESTAREEIEKDPLIFYDRIRDKIITQDLATSNRFFELTNKLAEVLVATEEVQGAMADTIYELDVAEAV